MPKSPKPLPSPAPGYIYKGAMTTFVVLRVFFRGTRKYVKAYSSMSGRVTIIRRDAFMAEYGLRKCIVP